MSGARQERLVETPGFGYTPIEIRDAVGAAANEEIRPWGLDTEWLGRQPSELPESLQDGPFHRFQVDRTYWFAVGGKYDEGTRTPDEYFPIEFRVYIYTIQEPPAELRDRLREKDVYRLQTLFDTGPYEGYMTGFNFVYHAENIENDTVGRDEVNNLGIPQFDVTVRRNQRVTGESSGFFDPFELVRQEVIGPLPTQEVWDLSWNPSRDDYQISPPGFTAARQRTRGLHGKTVYVNGKQVGTVTTDGRAWLAKSYQSDDQMYRGNWSREKLVQETAATYSAIRDGGNLYKTRETSDAVYLVTAAAKPDDFDPTPPEQVDPTQVGDVRDERIIMRLAGETTFNIRRDTGADLGRYSTPETRSIEFETHWNTIPYAQRR